LHSCNLRRFRRSGEAQTDSGSLQPGALRARCDAGQECSAWLARRELGVEEFRKSAREWTDRFSRLKVEENCWTGFVDGLDYLAGLDQADGFEKLKAKLEAIERRVVFRRIAFITCQSLPMRFATRSCGSKLPA